MTCEAALSNEYNVSTTSPAASKRGAGYAVYDPLGQRIGSAEEVFVNRDSEPGYGMVRTGLLGMRSVLIPEQFVQTDETRKTLVLK